MDCVERVSRSNGVAVALLIGNEMDAECDADGWITTLLTGERCDGSNVLQCCDNRLNSNFVMKLLLVAKCDVSILHSAVSVLYNRDEVGVAGCTLHSMNCDEMSIHSFPSLI